MITRTSLLLLFSWISFGCQAQTALPSNVNLLADQNFTSGTTALDNIPPVLSATGNQLYCPGSAMEIVTDMTITDPDDTGTNAVYIQISSGYVSSQDLLTLTGTHPNIVSSWNIASGKLTLQHPTGNVVSYTEFVLAIKDVVYSNNSATPSGSRTFSMTVGQANYLPSTGHYYQFVPVLGISWTDAKIAAESSTYYGLQGYLATLLAADESQLAGEQSAGAGWIGGSDVGNEGVWKWVTGPENGTVFWNGAANGSSPNFAFWNSGEPNNLGDEHYAHITAPGVGIPGSWNDLTLNGSGGDYQPKGYIVEYGGMPGDPVLNISTSSVITIPSIDSTTPASRCGAGIVILSATSAQNNISWYDSPTGGILLHTGSDFTTPLISTTTTYYADANNPNCSTGTRTSVTATITAIPLITLTSPDPSCEGSVTFEASTTNGTIKWFDAPIGGTEVATGNTFTTPHLTETTMFYAEGQDSGCNSTRIPASAVIYQKPMVNDEQIPICENAITTLDAGLQNVTYLWSPSQETTRYITIGAPGIYTVAITSEEPESCTAIKTFTVVGKTAPIISNIDVTETTVTINTTNSGDFEYSVDGINYQSSNVFIVEQPGIHTGYVRETNDCGSNDDTFIILKIPKFFSPNGDTHNDYWSVPGIVYYPNASIRIFDRFGRLIIELSNSNWNWDGTFNQNLLPATDYWYLLKYDDAIPAKLGHFSLIR